MSHRTPAPSDDTAHRFIRDAVSLLRNLLIFGTTVGGLVWMHVDNDAAERPVAAPSVATAPGLASH